MKAVCSSEKQLSVGVYLQVHASLHSRKKIDKLECCFEQHMLRDSVANLSKQWVGVEGTCITVLMTGYIITEGEKIV